MTLLKNDLKGTEQMKNIKRFAVLLLAAALMLSLAGCSASDYKAAGELYTSGDYKAAAEKYAALGDYKDSAALAVKSDYMYAREIYFAGAYAEAAEAFNALGDYEDSAEMAKECIYKLAVSNYNEGRYAEAIDVFLEIEGYSDSSDYISRAREAIVRESVLGEWRCVYPLGGMFEDGFGMASELKPSDYFDLSVFEAQFILTVNDDGSYSIDVDRDAYNSSLDEFSAGLKAGMPQMLLDSVKESLAEAGFTLDDVVKELGVGSVDEAMDILVASTLGMSTDDFVDVVIESFGAEEAFKDFPESGTFTVSGTSVTFTGQGTAEYDAVQETLTIPDDDFGDMVFTR